MGALLKKFWAGKLTENYVQAVARDVFAEGLVALHKAKIRTAFHLHDEYVNEVPKNFDKEEIRGVLNLDIPWLEGCPLDVEMQESDFYKK
jgi:DNA polymerase